MEEKKSVSMQVPKQSEKPKKSRFWLVATIVLALIFLAVFSIFILTLIFGTGVKDFFASLF